MSCYALVEIRRTPRYAGRYYNMLTVYNGDEDGWGWENANWAEESQLKVIQAMLNPPHRPVIVGLPLEEWEPA